MDTIFSIAGVIGIILTELSRWLEKNAVWLILFYAWWWFNSTLDALKDQIREIKESIPNLRQQIDEVKSEVWSAHASVPQWMQHSKDLEN